IVHLHRVAERAMAQADLEPHFWITAPDRLMDEPRQYLASHHLREVISVSAHYGPLAMANPVLRYRALRQANLNLARQILDTVRPAAILATVDACHDLFLAEATRRGIPTVYMQVAFWGDWSFYRDLWADDRRAAASRLTLPQRVKARINKTIQRGFGLHNRPAWWRDTSRIAVLGRHWEDLLSRGGIPAQRIAVTGNPHCDEIHEVKSGRGRWKELYQRLALPDGTRYLLHCREHHARLSSMPPEASREGEREIIEAFKSACPGMPIVVKMHPRDTPEDYAFVRSIDPRVIAVGDVPMIELLAQSLLMVTTVSTTQLWSAALDRPTISAFFWKGLDYWEKATAFSGVERVFTPEHLRASVARYMKDSTYQSLWQQKRQAFAGEMLVVDGHSIDRLVRLLHEPLTSA
ncbi:MAG: hypothetical protein ACREA0_01035, partial [bacterium]